MNGRRLLVVVAGFLSCFALAGEAEAQGKGMLRINSKPSARVYIRGKFRGETPLAIPLAHGRHKVILRARGYQELVVSADVQGGRKTVLFEKLTPLAPPMGRMAVRSEPPASIYLNGKNFGRTPMINRALPEGPYDVRLVTKGGREWSTRVHVRHGTPVNIEHRFPPRAARLRVRSNPEARVYLNGEHIGRTPLEVEDLRRGRHVLELRARGHFNEVIKFFAKPGDFQDVQRDLRPETARLRVRSNPEAEVFLNKRSIGRTPLEVDDLRRGRYLLELRAPGHLPEVIKFFAKPGDFQDVQRDLKPVFARLRVRSNPQARVYLNGEHIGETPIRREEIPPGRHTLELRARGHHPEVVKFHARPGELQDVERTLRPKVRMGYINATSRPDAKVFLNGEFVGVTPIPRLEVRPGRYELRFEPRKGRKGFIERRTVDVQPGRVTRVNVIMRRGRGRR